MSTIMEALGGAPGETIAEILGGDSGETIAEAIEKRHPKGYKLTIDPNNDLGGFIINHVEEEKEYYGPMTVDVTPGDGFIFDQEADPETGVVSGIYFYDMNDEQLENPLFDILIERGEVMHTFIGLSYTEAGEKVYVDTDVPFIPTKDITLLAEIETA